MTLLQLERVGMRYAANEQPVLKNISFTLSTGQFMVALGPSGSGKTTLLSLIAGFHHPTKGAILLDGKAITGPGPDRGVVFQHDALLPWQDVLGNVAFGMKLADMPQAEREQKARRLLAQVGLDGYDRRAVWQLSGGQRQRVGIARALAADPRILLLDEPFGALDAFAREQMQELLLSVWKKTAKPMFLITHDIEEAIFLATDLILMSPYPGRIIEHLQLGFGTRYANGESARSIKADPAFIETREKVLSRVFSEREQFLPHNEEAQS
ncbi:taurine ABC transporter ATP-binding subunit [Samsonia erythrinae]|uniref:Taurine transport system ATP-binding protein n=1 Tax=Samsonia erythrinae TaxID=160434 RepID=A0A4R3VDB4_9GAMM|nr:taurine ABC transporter ATP-binding subunit [Samsonia erythrinae]TCV03317.1 taurine transport system ATP-binding protein [Samsonia erythrinae]